MASQVWQSVGRGQTLTGRINGWKAILNTLTVHYGDRITNHL